ncbi:unnamed protein product [Vitrella brassicaformis CCMP3155]|uniref:Protein phosphatase n=1 Tax=Vitrella brassicaformis (strain CCMP3155) TaxID=1169540 RepID=A0A0G4E8Q3_VITBC|nr:unnamed protein product [Vitrella brassicaformis CCMP3155]|eukprot:CEL92246.1 unnamed protein product [Vitrella brassicaformis CCMP3155]
MPQCALHASSSEAQRHHPDASSPAQPSDPSPTLPPPPSVGKTRLQFNTAARQLSKNGYVSCQDAFYGRCDGLGVFDGVGGVRGPCDSQAFARCLAQHCMAETQHIDDSTHHRALKVLEGGWEQMLTRSTDKKGASTAVIGALVHPNILSVCVCGDSLIGVWRRGNGKDQDRYNLIYLSPAGCSGFNTPHQIGRLYDVDEDDDLVLDQPMLFSPRTLEGLHRYVSREDIPLQEGDIIVAASDGVWDNLYEREVTSLINSVARMDHMETPAPGSPADYAQKICHAAFVSSVCPFFRTPFRDKGREELPAHRLRNFKQQGGKIDDITVVCAIVASVSADLPLPPPLDPSAAELPQPQIDMPSQTDMMRDGYDDEPPLGETYRQVMQRTISKTRRDTGRGVLMNRRGKGKGKGKGKGRENRSKKDKGADGVEGKLKSPDTDDGDDQMADVGSAQDGAGSVCEGALCEGVPVSEPLHVDGTVGVVEACVVRVDSGVPSDRGEQHHQNSPKRPHRLMDLESPPAAPHTHTSTKPRSLRSMAYFPQPPSNRTANIKALMAKLNNNNNNSTSSSTDGEHRMVLPSVSKRKGGGGGHGSSMRGVGKLKGKVAAATSTNRRWGGEEAVEMDTDD